jgi:hypothetical protein
MKNFNRREHRGRRGKTTKMHEDAEGKRKKK